MRHGVSETEDADDNRVTQSLAALAFALLLVVVGLFLVQTLRANGQVEDCLLSGRRNCDQVMSRV